jgi:hypothetical protein
LFCHRRLLLLDTACLPWRKKKALACR